MCGPVVVRDGEEADPTKIYACDQCNMKYGMMGHLLRHKRACHNDDPTEGFVCPVCKMEFKKATRLRYHLYEHTGRYWEEILLFSVKFRLKFIMNYSMNNCCRRKTVQMLQRRLLGSVHDSDASARAQRHLWPLVGSLPVRRVQHGTENGQRSTHPQADPQGTYARV